MPRRISSVGVHVCDTRIRRERTVADHNYDACTDNNSIATKQ